MEIWFSLLGTLAPFVVIGVLFIVGRLLVERFRRRPAKQWPDPGAYINPVRRREEIDRIRGVTRYASPPFTPPPKPKDYTKAKRLMSPAETAFFRVLKAAVPEAPIFPKVRVADVIQARERYSGAFLKISQKHFDWVLCHPTTFEPIVAIELDDSSHQWDKRQQKADAAKNHAAAEAGLRLIRIPWARSYDEDALRDRIAAEVNAVADEADGVR